ncbi:MAG: TlpA family protein disulfide reductase [Candidatus Sericytochromatia bacterium]|uniref:TlpA family protein disulfide reductase n=1 Tax=Candidatus Tanganyikabacteria bacterium TaxID=2961651 RepID=A0A937X0F4_9BACT|nr:TlpA family protein disulfide reductase [Candidatus Tanganyikabacteria bacterium]
MALIPDWLKKWGPIALAVGLVSFMYARGEGAGSMSGRIAPDFTLPRLGGGDFTLSKLDGKVRVLDFWATWCGPCKMMTPHLVDLHKKYYAKGVVVVGIALDDAADVQRYVEEHGVPYPIVLGDGSVAERFGGVQGIPTTFVLDRGGRVVKRHVGYRPLLILEADVAPLI